MDNDDQCFWWLLYFFRKSELIKQNSTLELTFTVGSLYEYQDKERY